MTCWPEGAVVVNVAAGIVAGLLLAPSVNLWIARAWEWVKGVGR